MNLSQKIELVHRQLPKPSEVDKEELIYMIKHRQVIKSIKPHYPLAIFTYKIQLIFQKDYVADEAIGWTLVKNMNVNGHLPPD